MKSEFREIVLHWYSVHKRELPWRRTKDPYRVWLSEVILQQTRVSQGLPYYLRFVERFPRVEDLAAATEEEVLKIWQGLGYYRRALHLHQAAKTIVEDYGGQFPETYTDLLKLKGVGEYTASAVSSICFDEKRPVLDGNVYRLMARYFGIYSPVNVRRSKAEFMKLAGDLIPAEQPGEYNQAVMELGSLICSPKQAQCKRCPLSSGCYAYKENSVDKLPVKIPKQARKKRYLDYLVFETPDGAILLEKRTQNDIWKGLYQFPLLEGERPATRTELLRHPVFETPDKVHFHLSEKPLKSYIRILTHRELHVNFWLVRI